METVKYLCEFFFTNFWHWLGLVILIGFVPAIRFIKVIDNSKNEKSHAEDNVQ